MYRCAGSHLCHSSLPLEDGEKLCLGGGAGHATDMGLMGSRKAGKGDMGERGHCYVRVSGLSMGQHLL